MLSAHSKVTLAGLRKRHPDFTWTAERKGMVWEYVGNLPGVKPGGCTVRIYSRAHMVIGTDDFETRWYLRDVGGTVRDYWGWVAEEVIDEGRSKAPQPL